MNRAIAPGPTNSDGRRHYCRPAFFDWPGGACPDRLSAYAGQAIHLPSRDAVTHGRSSTRHVCLGLTLKPGGLGMHECQHGKNREDRGLHSAPPGVTGGAKKCLELANRLLTRLPYVLRYQWPNRLAVPGLPTAGWLKGPRVRPVMHIA